MKIWKQYTIWKRHTKRLQFLRPDYSGLVFKVALFCFIVVNAFAQSIMAQELDPSVLQWVSLGNLRYAHYEGNIAVLNSHQILVIGGYDGGGNNERNVTAVCEIVDIQKKHIHTALPMSVAHAEAALVQNGDSNLVIISGVSNGGVLTGICEYFDHYYRSWRQIGTLIVPRRSPLATFISNEEILVVGGFDSRGKAVTATEIVNIKTGKSKLVAPFPVPMVSGICFVSMDFDFPKVVVICTSAHDAIHEESIYGYHEKNNRWEHKGKYFHAIARPRFIRHFDQRAIIWDDSSSLQDSIFPRDGYATLDIEAFHGFRQLAMMQTASFAYNAAQWNNDTLLIVGGCDKTGKIIQNTEWADLLTGKCYAAPPLLNGRKNPFVMSLPIFNELGYLAEKSVVVLGGIDADGRPLSSIELLREVSPALSHNNANHESGSSGSFLFALTLPIILILTAGIIGCLVMALLYVVRTLQLQLQTEQQHLKTQQEKEHLGFQIAKLRLQTLQLQMKPHFVYNSLAAVESLVLENQNEKASYYIRVLAKLFRIVLEHSDNSTVKVHDVIEFLKVYIALEQLRMDYVFDYDIRQQLSMPEVQMYIPSMLIQPYIENAIKYGIGLLQDFNALHPQNKRQGSLIIEFSMAMVEGQSYLQCIVEDNGVGRAKSQEVYSKRSSYEGLSRSTRVNEQRLTLLSSLNLQVRSVRYDDLTDQDGHPIGTRVMLYIPIFTQQYFDAKEQSDDVESNRGR